MPAGSGSPRRFLNTRGSWLRRRRKRGGHAAKRKRGQHNGRDEPLLHFPVSSKLTVCQQRRMEAVIRITVRPEAISA
jgi:hypothetical protein